MDMFHLAQDFLASAISDTWGWTRSVIMGAVLRVAEF